jgi:hypothetical protein
VPVAPAFHFIHAFLKQAEPLIEFAHCRGSSSRPDLVGLRPTVERCQQLRLGMLNTLSDVMENAILDIADVMENATLDLIDLTEDATLDIIDVMENATLDIIDVMENASFKAGECFVQFGVHSTI